MLKRYHDTTGGATFEVIPAIDLRGGRVVRLSQGDFERESRYSDDPVAVAADFAAAGARRIHIVDLDGARAGEPAQSWVLTAIVAAVRTVDPGVQCQVAGGLRTEAAVAAALDSGAARAVVGTAALADPAFARRLVETHGAERVVVALDVRDGQAVGEGWREGAPGTPVATAIAHLADAGVRTFAATAIERDGLLGGPDVDLLRRLIALGRGDIIASGGIGSIDDLERLRTAGCIGAIVGRALYEGRFDLAAAMAALADRQTSGAAKRALDGDAGAGG